MDMLAFFGGDGLLVACGVESGEKLPLPEVAGVVRIGRRGGFGCDIM